MWRQIRAEKSGVPPYDPSNPGLPPLALAAIAHGAPWYHPYWGLPPHGALQVAHAPNQPRFASAQQTPLAPPVGAGQGGHQAPPQIAPHGERDPSVRENEQMVESGSPAGSERNSRRRSGLPRRCRDHSPSDPSSDGTDSDEGGPRRKKTRKGRQTCNPLTQEIQDAVFPPRFKPPTIRPYDGE